MPAKKALELAEIILQLISSFAKGIRPLKKKLTNDGKRWQIAVELAKQKPQMASYIQRVFKEIGLLYRSVSEAEKDPGVQKAHEKKATAKAASKKKPDKQSKKKVKKASKKKATKKKKVSRMPAKKSARKGRRK